MGNKDMKVNLNKGAIEGLSLEQGSSFPLLPAPRLQRTLLDVHVDFDKKQHEMLQPSKCDIRRSRAWAELQQTCRLKDGCSLGALYASDLPPRFSSAPSTSTAPPVSTPRVNTRA